jgi:hypothetical protein
MLTPTVRPVPVEDVERAARRALRGQIAKLERELADAFVTAWPMGGLQAPRGVAGEPRLLDLGELEQIRDALAQRLHDARASIAERAELQAEKRLLLEQMLLEPGRYRFARVSCRELGEPGCGVWQVRPRLGLIGMLMGWWEVKLSSGCPLAGGRGRRSRPGDTSSYPGRVLRDLARTGAGAVLVVLIMFIGSLVLWIGTPLLWLWIGSQVQGSTSSLGAALGTMFVGVIATIAVLASVLGKLSNVYRANCLARGRGDPGHYVLEGVLVVSAGFTLVAFVVWFFLFAGASPVPLGIQL